MAQIQYQFSKMDEYFTPSYAVYPIMKRLKPGTVIWCPFDTKASEYVKVFSRNGFHVIYGHIQTGQGRPRHGVPFQSGYLCSGICQNQLEFEYLDKQKKG